MSLAKVKLGRDLHCSSPEAILNYWHKGEVSYKLTIGNLELSFSATKGILDGFPLYVSSGLFTDQPQ